MNVFYSTDWHGEFDKAKKALELANFDYKEDTLIFGGDYCDRGSQSFECMELLLSIKNLIYLRGNHCECVLDMFTKGDINLWKYGQKETLKSYIKNSKKYKNSDYKNYVSEKLSGVISKIPTDLAPKSHIDILINSKSYYIDSENRLFVHAGYDPNLSMEENSPNFTWDRDYVNLVINQDYTDVNFKEVFIGHTPVQYFNSNEIINKNNIWLCDTGAGKLKEAPVSIININTKEIYYAN
jgi:serine/threonine protein phosphatase 1